MPEIKEIRKFADFIREKIKNKEILDINILNGRYKNHGPFTNFNVLKKELPLKIKEVKTKVNEYKIDLEGYNDGIYFVKVTNEKMKKSFKIIVKK